MKSKITYLSSSLQEILGKKEHFNEVYHLTDTETCKGLNNNLKININQNTNIKKVINKSSKHFNHKICKEYLLALTNKDSNNSIDWTIVEFLSSMPPGIVINEFIKLNNKFCLHNSPAINWLFGEFKIEHEVIIEFLKQTLNKTTSSEAFWNAAISLEELRQGDAINLMKTHLKREVIINLTNILQNLDDKKNIVRCLLVATSKNVKEVIYPELKNKIVFPKSETELANAIWLAGRLRVIDNEIKSQIIKHVNENNNYSVKHSCFFAMCENPNRQFYQEIMNRLKVPDPISRKLCIRYLANDENTSPSILENLLMEERNSKVIAEISQAIYKLKNPNQKRKLRLYNNIQLNEIGLIVDSTDKWYGDPSIYNIFSEAEDPENVCFDIILKKLETDTRQIRNPIDLATGTGRTLKQILLKLNFDGIAYGIDINEKMTDYLKRDLNRSKRYACPFKVITQSIENIKLPEKSNFIISSFGFPSNTFDCNKTKIELQNILNILAEDGVFVTIGWDEKFNDELNHVWYKYLNDDISANNFEDWRLQRTNKIKSPRNCNLSWLKTGLKLPLIYNNLDDSIRIMSQLFGRDIIKEIIETNKIDWEMSMGITYNTKQDLERIVSDLDE